jgi:predicted SprT family Zn-dependent metalloprotease
MAVCGVAQHNLLTWGTDLAEVRQEQNSEFTDSESQAFHEKTLSISEENDSQIAKIWSHFHSSPTGGSQEEWKQFFEAQKDLEDGLNRGQVEYLQSISIQLDPQGQKVEVLKFFKIIEQHPLNGFIYYEMRSEKKRTQLLLKNLHKNIKLKFQNSRPTEHHFDCPLSHCQSQFEKVSQLNRHIGRNHSSLQATISAYSLKIFSSRTSKKD